MRTHFANSALFVAAALLFCLSGFAQNYGPVRHNSEPPLGDGETGGNVACYFYDPDYNNVEFCGAMDTIENYRARYGDKKGTARA